MSTLTTQSSIVGEPEVVEDVQHDASWLDLKAAVIALRLFQTKDGDIPDEAAHPESRELVARIRQDLLHLAPHFPHDADYLAALDTDLARWADDGGAVP